MTQNFFSFSLLFSPSLFLLFFLLAPVFCGALLPYHHLIAPYIWLCVSLFPFSIISYSLLLFFFLLLRSPEQLYTQKYICFFSFDLWFLRNIVSYGFSLHHIQSLLLTFPGILSGFSGCFLTRKIIVTSSLFLFRPPFCRLLFSFSGFQQRAQKASLAPIMRLNVIRLSRYINCI